MTASQINDSWTYQNAQGQREEALGVLIVEQGLHQMPDGTYREALGVKVVEAPGGDVGFEARGVFIATPIYLGSSSYQAAAPVFEVQGRYQDLNGDWHDPVLVTFVDGGGFFEVTASVNITGTTEEGSELTANFSYSDEDLGAASNVAYQWLRDGVDIAGANASTYTLVSADLGAMIAVRVNFDDSQGTARAVTSAAVGPVIEAVVDPGDSSSITTPGAGQFQVPNYDLLVVEGWGPGGSGCGIQGNDNYPTGVTSEPTTIDSLGLSAGHGLGGQGSPATNEATGGDGGTAVGGDTNINGEKAPNNTSTTVGGRGGNAPNGGLGGAAVANAAGLPGVAPGGGGSSAESSGLGDPQAGGGSGAYTRKTFRRGITVGAPLVGSILDYVVGASPGPTPAASPGGAGARGELRFIVQQAGTLVAIGGAGKIFSSDNGMDWTSHDVGDSLTNWRDVVYAPGLGLFVAVGNRTSGTDLVATSPDGETWTLRTAAAASDWRGIAWSEALGLLVAVPAGVDTFMTSPDGINWTSRPLTVTNNGWNTVAWSPTLGLFAAGKSLGDTERIWTSPDGINWTPRTTPQLPVQKIIWSEFHQKFFASLTDNNNLSSSDGITWVTSSGSMTATTHDAIAVNDDDGTIIVSDTGVWSSPDGDTFTQEVGSTVDPVALWHDPRKGLYLAGTLAGEVIWSDDLTLWRRNDIHTSSIRGFASDG